MRRIYIPGETTYDIIFKNNKPIDAKVGGSQLNTAISLGRLNLPISFITQIGSDNVGDICAGFIKENGIDDSFIKRNKGTSRVALAFLDENNNANYNFLKAEHSSPFNFPDAEENDIILFGSSFAIRTDIRDELVRFLEKAKAKNSIIIYDPNFRKRGELNQGEKIKLVKENIQLSTIVKGSDDDFKNLFGTKNSKGAWKEIKELGVKSLLYTANKNGVYAHWENNSLFVDVPKINPLSTIGAGDNFNTGVIYSILKSGIRSERISNLKEEDYREIIHTATIFAQQVCLSYDNYISIEFAKSKL